MKLWLPLLVSSLQAVNALWPAPREYTSGDKYVKLHESFSIVPRGTFTVPEDLRAAMVAAEEQIKLDKMLPLEVDLAGVESEAKATDHILYFLNLELTSSKFNINQPAKRNTALFNTKNRKVPSISSNINLPFEDRDESYSLEITLKNPVANLTAPTTLGLLRGLQTFTQLVYTISDEDSIRYIRGVPIAIQDKPAYPVRGLLLDTARNYYPTRDVKRTLDAMSWAKMN